MVANAPGSSQDPREPRPDEPFVSVIVPVLGTERLHLCLASLADQTYAHYEVIVVDNGAPRDLIPLVESFERCRIVREERRGSYSARNAGIRAAEGRVLAFTDADCVPAPAWIERGVQALQRDPGCAVVGGRIEVTVPDPDSPGAFGLYELHTSFRQQEYVERWGFAATANLFTWRQVIEAVGPFDPHLLSMGDREWGTRVTRAGLSLVYAHEAKIVHPARTNLRSLWSRTARTTGGFMSLIRKKGWGPGSIARDAPIGLLPVSASGEERAPLSKTDRFKLLSVSGLVLGIRLVEVARLLAGGEAVHR